MFFTLNCYGHIPVSLFIPYSTVLFSSYIVIKYAAFMEHAGQGCTVFKFLEKGILKMWSELYSYSLRSPISFINYVVCMNYGVN